MEIADLIDEGSGTGNLGDVGDRLTRGDLAIADNLLADGVRRPEGTGPTVGDRLVERACRCCLRHRGSKSNSDAGGDENEGCSGCYCVAK